MPFEYFEADSHVSTYNKFRPSPPKNLIEKVVEFTSEKIPEPLDLAVDVGCGSGQSTEVLAPYFKKVFGLDSSPQIINEARKKCSHLNVFYSISSGEKMDMEDKTVNLITACQSVHWFDIPKFYSEAERVLTPKGVLAVYGYNLPVPVFKDEEIGIIEKYYKDVLGPYTLPQSRKVYLENYSSEEFNEIDFIEGKKMQKSENFILETQGKISDMMGYVMSWSAYQNYTKLMGQESGEKLLKNFEAEFKDILKAKQNQAEEFRIRFNYFLLLGRKE